MSKTLPKGHLSCLSNSFRYTPAAGTNVANTFARIKQELGEQETHASASRGRIELPAVQRGRPFPAETIERARRLQLTLGDRGKNDAARRRPAP